MKRSRMINRQFSVAFKKEKVELIDQGKMSVRDVCKIYDVSDASVYNWKKKYSKYSKAERVVVEKVSEENKNKELLTRIAELERIVGKKQLALDYYKTTVKKLSEEAGENLEKKYKLKS